MIRACVRQGRLEAEDPIPEEWEGQFVKIVPLTPNDPQPDLEERLALLQALGPTEFEPGERETAASAASTLKFRVAALARVRGTRVRANAATRRFSCDSALACWRSRTA